MKYLKRPLYVIITLVFLIIIVAFIAVKIEDHQTAYLKIENQPDLQNNSYIIRHVNIIPMTTDTVLRDMDIIVENGNIESIGKDLENQSGNAIDAKGAYLSPGLIDMHMHLWDRFELGLYLSNGVTTVRSLLGMPFHLEVKNNIDSEKFIGPLFYTSSPQFTGTEDGDIVKKPIKTPQEAKELVAKYKEQGYDYIKTYNLLPKDIFDAVLEQSVISDIPVVAHPSFLVDYPYHFNTNISTVEHTEDIYQQPLNYKFDLEKLDSVVSGYATSKQSHCPTLTVFYNLTEIYNKGEGYLEAEQAGYINSFINHVSGDFGRHMAIRESDSTSTRRINDQHDFHIEIVKRLHESGVKIVCGTDAGIVNTAAGFSIHQELDFYTQAGMSNYEALKTATVNPTKVYENYQEFGTIEEGKLANFILSKGNPLNNLSTLKNPEWVMIKGRLINHSMMEEFKQKAYKRDNYIATMVRVLKYVLWEK